MWLPARWTDKQGWDFHIKDTGIVRECIQDVESGKDINIERIGEMTFKREWMEDHGEGNPPNYDWLKETAEELFHRVEAGEFKPGFIERKVYQKSIFYGLTKFKQDSAYREIMGAWLTVTVLDPAPWNEALTKEDRVAYLNRLCKWLDQNYQRKRTKPWVMALLSDFIKRYESSEFVEQTTNWFYDKLVEHREKWLIDEAYDPKKWYPVGRGYIQNKIRGGMG